MAVSLLIRCAADPPLYLPARDPALISVIQVLDAVRTAGEAHFVSPDALPTPPSVEQVLDQIRSAQASAVGAISLRELVKPEGEKSLAHGPVDDGHG